MTFQGLMIQFCNKLKPIRNSEDFIFTKLLPSFKDKTTIQTCTGSAISGITCLAGTGISPGAIATGGQGRVTVVGTTAFVYI